MRSGVIGNLVAHSCSQRKSATILELGVKLTLQAKHEMALAAPVVCYIARGVFDSANAQAVKMTGLPDCCSLESSMMGGFDL